MNSKPLLMDPTKALQMLSKATTTTTIIMVRQVFQ